ncbi:MAG TPA: hypothetical protein VKU40_10045, partial [Thermoanaerobaculia bacterium]|nr:hypothetical protein [Thermoanaerobaculia bacterium]
MRRSERERGGWRGRAGLFLGLMALLAFVLLAGLEPAPAAADAAAPADPGSKEAEAVDSRNDWTALYQQGREGEALGSLGCLSCHVGIEDMHASGTVHLGCTDCHGGDASAERPPAATPGSEPYRQAMEAAHVLPRHPERWGLRDDGTVSSANPVRSYTLLNDESPEFIRFVNPGDLRVAETACGGCHQGQVNAVAKSTMTTSSVFWAAAAYANGILGRKAGLLGESYGPDGRAQGAETMPGPDLVERGVLSLLVPLPRFEYTQPGEYFRAFERGGLLQPSQFPEIGNPSPFDEPGRPDVRLSNRGLGTGLRISPGVLNLHKTRLNDPHLSFLGTNDQPGDFRSSGCTGCHVMYANDRDPAHSGPYARFGHWGESASGDPTIPRGEPGHPIRHQLTRAVTTSQCMVCHMHQPNSFVNTYLGYTMWDYETDGELLWPEEQRYPTEAEKRAVLERNPEGAAPRGLWGDVDFLAGVRDLNSEAEHTQFADYHGHGWVFRAVFKRDRRGNLLDGEGNVVPFDDAERFAKAVHMSDAHLDAGMHCVDCHFSQDAHGDGNLHGEYGNAIEIECQDCHGGLEAATDLRTSGPAAPPGGTDLALGITPYGERRFRWRDGGLYQRSMVEEGLEWKVVQVRDTVTAGSADYNERSAWAKTVRRDGESWGLEESPALEHGMGADVSGVEGHPPIDDASLAHGELRMTCYACHSAWVTNCFGCHLPNEANVRSATQHYEGKVTRNFASYNPQVIRTDAYMLGVNGDVKGNKIAPVRSSSALVLSSINQNRQRIYIQQPPISAPGFSSQAFNPHVPHTVRGAETKACSDCHLSDDGDNNAWMAQLLLQGTGYVNFMGRFAWVGLGHHGLEAVAVTEWEEPQAVYGSHLHRLAYPDDFADHQAAGGELETAHHHHGAAFGSEVGEVRSLQLRGEYLYTAKGPGGFEVFDVANVDNKDFSERIITAPVSPLGQRTSVRTAWASAVALPTTMPMALDRTPDPANREQPIHPIYRYAFVADRQEGLVLVDVATLTDREPRNNFVRRAATFNPDGALTGAEGLTVAGHWVYVVTAGGDLAVVDCSTPLEPRLAAVLSGFDDPRAVAVQFRYAFVADAGGLAVVDVTKPEAPRLAARADGFGAGRSVYLARTYAYVAAGERGVAIVDVERPEAPKLDRLFDAGGELHDVHDVQVASTGSSLFAYVADGEHGLKVLQLTSPASVPGYLGFSPRPEPRLIARRHTEGPALALSRGLDRDRAVDESGHQVSVFNRIGAR